MPGCGCGGSTQAPPANGQQAPQRLEGGPGQVGYTWNGPNVPAPPVAPAAEPVPAAAE